eukprot:CAMPEP_0113627434 /NCGR_PEP_ID=MMETSP0017_2-20120614/14209_1 /TAXON_ID=2856 /ORGANISM="Cylindrotheca closterium" /LENGTH=785 /DNA_ID=CAMNT_0000537691 /DNA_START=23 /DNA_END=2380 /DNA_ORIENTATION=+ /assembly_acc=CAM_ASM_000147
MSSSEEDEDQIQQRNENLARQSDDDDDDSNNNNAASTARQRNHNASSSTPSSSYITDHDEDTIRIMLSTDNHLGYCEGDAVRGMDSFAALEEVLWLARHYNADLVLLAGDLFHMNKPSRGTLHKTMDLFRRYCMGDNPIQIQILSNQARNFANGSVNYEDENYSVDLPVFSIHGNHDDPTREAGSTDLFCALDLLDVANLVNYFGKQDKIDQVQVSPILMKKGDTHLALYGLGSMRDERLHRMWRSQQLKFLRPEPPESDSNAWFNLFALHQNRDFGRGTKNCIQETMIPEWMDLVCWGHEHESSVEPSESVVGTFRITQPGSSVATSLSAGEAERKQVGILDIRGTNYRILPIPLTQVRSFTRGGVNLADVEGLNPDGPKVDREVTEVLDERVRVLVHDAREQIKETMEEAEEKGNVLAAMENLPLKYTLQKPESVLVRLNVDHSGFSVLNNQRFGAKFVGEVANPTDILLYSRKKAASQKKSTSKKLSEIEPIEPDDLETMKIEDLIVGELETADQKMEVFDEKRMTNALDSYVDKQEAQAIPEAVENLLTKEQKKWIKKGSSPSKNERDSKESETTTKKRGRNVVAEEEDDDDFGSEDEQPAAKKKAPPAKKKRATKAAPKKAAAKRNVSNSSDSEIEEIEDESPPPKKKTARASRARKTVKQSYTESSDDEIEEVEPPPKRSRGARATKKVSRRATSDSDNDDDDDIEVIDEPPPAKKRGRRSAASQSSSRKESLSQSQLSFAPVQRKSRKKAPKGRLYSHDDDDEMEDGWGTAKTETNER